MCPLMIRTLFWNTINKRGLLIVEGDDIRLIITIGRTLAGDD